LDKRVAQLTSLTTNPRRACGTFMDARAFGEAELIGGVHRSSMAQLAAWTL
jgi:hypothetical protein